MAKGKSMIVGLKCSKCSQINYTTFRSINQKEKLALKKYCKYCGGHTDHQETKIPKPKK